MAITIPCKNGETHELYNPLEASIYMGVSLQTLNKWRVEGYIRSFKIGRGNAYTREELDSGLRLLNERNLGASRSNEDRENINLKYV
tara:strand:+ start:106 stop:366 length:261 start_codon:yes stop_codon:yes gene_type:complete